MATTYEVEVKCEACGKKFLEIKHDDEDYIASHITSRGFKGGGKIFIFINPKNESLGKISESRTRLCDKCLTNPEAHNKVRIKTFKEKMFYTQKEIERLAESLKEAQDSIYDISENLRLKRKAVSYMKKKLKTKEW